MNQFFGTISLTIFLSLYSLQNLVAGTTEEPLTQVSTIDALLNGVYDGSMSLEEMTQYGDFGIGTFHALNGEMLVLDGKFYQITSDGEVHIAPQGTTTPFAAVTFFETDQSAPLPSGMSFEQFEQETDTLLPTPNIFYGLKIEGVFKKMKTRSVPKQVKPYPPLKEIAKTQPVFEFENIEGVLVGFRCPPYVKGINVPGYHLHFLSKDRKSGGHVLDFTIESGALQIDYTSNFSMRLPEKGGFLETNLKNDKSLELKAVEK